MKVTTTRSLISIALLLSATITEAAQPRIRNFQKPINTVVLPKEAEGSYDDATRWTSLNENTEFIRIHDNVPLTQRFLQGSSSSSYGGNTNPYASQAYVPGGDVEYDEYQTAWRYLGLMMDCDVSMDDDAWNEGSQDEYLTGEGCVRYLLWAAYVDLDYEGGGIAEYQYWDKDNKKWDKSACLYNEENGDNNDDGNPYGRCAKMDCHLDSTHFSLLGLFKHRSPDDWMEQLFKHSGYCLWDHDEYNYMNNARDTWPKGCSTSAIDGIYYDLQPQHGGSFTIGLYTDTRCVEPYRDGEYTAEDVVGNLLSEGQENSHDSGDYNLIQYDTLKESIAAWQSSFEVYAICQPCVAHDLKNVGYNYDDDSMKGDTYWDYMGGKYGYYNDDDGGNNNNNNNNGYDCYNDFDCCDDADYQNVNQCMKFMAKTTINAATYRDLSLAMDQQSLVKTLPVVMNADAYMVNQGARTFATLVLFAASCGFLYFASVALNRQLKTNNNVGGKDMKEPILT
mmetsp:Transcript_21416/g.32352  ORF Transcript_21416/g.32352 Transcript_21416/m.32352 type:complete len:507 (+) Transcript_21416:132-1652(+)|eukprot:CAMPEP_0178917370 /NCGR_PEP_ID=MMETSP0786-20121207/13209_1 /TAXON_ID=186022 /ORGANISM="Thalassionema frauenfeldii, Strain CCMP 1798" /LENGTH=506 /DNA_ID=CAMNT_0020590913 /DNA_START=126 /DNA_END=1646 /DNA_ORIENTATION=-